MESSDVLCLLRPSSSCSEKKKARSKKRKECKKMMSSSRYDGATRVCFEEKICSLPTIRLIILGHAGNDAPPDGLAFEHVPADGADVAEGKDFEALADELVELESLLGDVT